MSETKVEELPVLEIDNTEWDVIGTSLAYVLYKWEDFSKEVEVDAGLSPLNLALMQLQLVRLIGKVNALDNQMSGVVNSKKS